MEDGLTDIEMANGLEFEDTFDERVYEMEYEVSVICLHLICCP